MTRLFSLKGTVVADVQGDKWDEKLLWASLERQLRGRGAILTTRGESDVTFAMRPIWDFSGWALLAGVSGGAISLQRADHTVCWNYHLDISRLIGLAGIVAFWIVLVSSIKGSKWYLAIPMAVVVWIAFVGLNYVILKSRFHAFLRRMAISVS
jgi:hypothetical protein